MPQTIRSDPPREKRQKVPNDRAINRLDKIRSQPDQSSHRSCCNTKVNRRKDVAVKRRTSKCRAVTGQGLDELLEAIALQAETAGTESEPEPWRGWVP